ncbi:hypothetical protein F0562_003362 [Nyssa sinensis]|uniref:Uncharacterized protein n=1 Tax=Nyssa sinensis TaxID=561372 RepID=A0A5J5BUY6_9ASTE|nr:hypothetical protein F0562_003362 [Nyssa sinensis]
MDMGIMPQSVAVQFVDVAVLWKWRRDGSTVVDLSVEWAVAAVTVGGANDGAKTRYDTVRFIRQSKKQGSMLIYTLGLMLCEVEIGKWAVLELEPQNPAIYISLPSMYSAKGEWDKVTQFSLLMTGHSYEISIRDND